MSLIALFLQDHYEPFFASGAFRTKARALLLLERWEEAFQAFEDSLAARRASPGAIDDAWLQYPLTIAQRRARDRYQRAMEVLNEFLSPTALVFPLQQFWYFATLALICRDEGRGFTGRVGAAGQGLTTTVFHPPPPEPILAT